MDRVQPSAVLQEIRLPAFKSVRSATLPLRSLTLVVGRNGSGKSNVLDGLWVLSRLAAGGEIRDQLDGGREGPAIRGGVEGCAPLGSDRFELGCTVGVPNGAYHLDVTVCVRPVVQIRREHLWYEPRSRSAKPRTGATGPGSRIRAWSPSPGKSSTSTCPDRTSMRSSVPT